MSKNIPNKDKNDKKCETFRIITLGESGVGKTSILKRFLYNIFDIDSRSTIGLSFSNKEIILKNNETIQLKLIDTGGQEKYRALAKSYFKNADGVFFVYSKDNQESFNNIKDWIKQFNEEHNGKEGIPQYLVESKSDLERIVDENKSIEFAKENNLIFMKTSSKDNNAINELFQDIGELLYQNFLKYNNGNIKQNCLRLKNKNKNKKKSRCCLSKSNLDMDFNSQ